METIVSPWAETFDSFVRSIRRHAIVVAPFITERPLRHFASLLNTSNSPRISLLTNLNADSLLQGSVDSQEIAKFCREVPATTVRHLPGLHAKAYVADDHTAIITSGNLTAGSLYRNYEYGVRVDDPTMVQRIASDLHDYGKLGAGVSLEELDYLAEISISLRDKHFRALDSARADAKREFQSQLETARESLRQLRGKPGETANSIFGNTILYILKDGPLTTREMHPLIKHLQPDLCDDSMDRVIGGIRFGKKWKHSVRNAQQHLRRSGLIDAVHGKWHLIRTE